MRPLASASLLVALSACPVAESSEEPATGCATDADCADGQLCGSDGRCFVNGGGGSGPEGRACQRSDDCLTSPFSLVPEFHWDGLPGVDEVCTLPDARCPPGDECETQTICRTVSTDAERPGAFACERDEECWSGRCLALGEGKLCLRVCASDGDCPATTDDDGATVGHVCRRDVLDGTVVHRCVPAEPLASTATLCRADRECPDGLACRFHGDAVELVLMSRLPLCVAPVPARPTLARCLSGPDGCAGGACAWPCDGGYNDEGNFCRSEPYRCTAPCELDSDCPDRSICALGESQHRVGSFPLPFQGGFDERPGRDVRQCLMARPGCFEQQDCCPTRLPDGSCADGWGAADGRCGIELVGPPGGERLLTYCRPFDERATPGTCCDAHEACDSDLCVPARDGTACAGGGVCTVPCDPDPDPDGLPGTGDERDRCAELPSEGDYLAGSRCELVRYERLGRSWELRACR